MRRIKNLIVMFAIVIIFVFSIFVGQDSVVAQVSTCSECDSRFVNALGDKIRKLTVKKDLRVKRNAFVDGQVGIGTTAPNSALHVGNGPVTYTTANKTTDYILTDSDDVIFFDASVGTSTVTLPPASVSTIGRVYRICKTDSSDGWFIITPDGTDTIIGETFVNTKGVCLIVIGQTATQWFGTRGL